VLSESRAKTILVVDDSPLVNNQVTDLLEGFGYRTVSAANGAEGMKALQNNNTLDLVVLDLVMPVMDGRAMLLEIRSRKEFADLPVLVLTALEHIHRLSDHDMAGIDDYLIKPVDPRLLYQRVQALIETHPRAYRRVACSLLADVDTGTEQSVGEIVEISEGGIGLFPGSELREKDIIKLTFNLPGDQSPLIIGAQVVFCHRIETGWQAGLRFAIIHPETIGRIADYFKLRFQ